MSIREIAETLNIHNSTVCDHLKRLGFVPKLNIWVPHDLKEVHLTARINICDMLIKREESDLFLKRMVTGYEKWIVYNNVVRKQSWYIGDENLSKRIYTIKEGFAQYGGISKVFSTKSYQGKKAK